MFANANAMAARPYVLRVSPLVPADQPAVVHFSGVDPNAIPSGLVAPASSPSIPSSTPTHNQPYHGHRTSQRHNNGLAFFETPSQAHCDPSASTINLPLDRSTGSPSPVRASSPASVVTSNSHCSSLESNSSFSGLFEALSVCFHLSLLHLHRP